MTKFLNISTDTTLGGSTPSDDVVSSQKALKTYIDSQTGTAPAFANIVGQPSDNANLATALNAKQDSLSVTQMGAVNSGANTTNIAQIATNTNDISTINGKIPSQASTSNQLADKSYVDTADNGLQQQIDAITSASDVTDIVGTYAALQAYDTTSLPNNSIIKVLQDESRSNETTYYRWVITAGVGAWVLIGEEGPYYTIAAANATFQEILVSGTNIKTINNNSILGSGDITISGGGSSRNIGEIVASTIPLADAGLHALDGSLIASGSYADFVDYIGDLYDSGNYSDLFDTEANWQTAVTTYGVCGKFVYDSVNGTVRLPKISGFIEGTLDVTKLGDLVEAGLPNITAGYAPNGFKLAASDLTAGVTGAFYLESLSNQARMRADGSTNNAKRLNFDASRSSSIYGNSTTVQPQSIKVIYYIVIANSTKTPIQVDIDEVMTDLNGKADVDLSNCTKPHIVETYVNGTEWYRVYSDGWVEQGGKSSSGTSVTVNFLKPFVDTSFTIIGIKNRSAASANPVSVSAVTTASATFATSSDGAPVYWEAKGYGASN